MFGKLMDREHFVVACKGCGKNIPAGVQEFPFKSLEVECGLCNAKRQYRPSEVFSGRVTYDLKAGKVS